jgi:hypothetical protein
MHMRLPATSPFATEIRLPHMRLSADIGIEDLSANGTLGNHQQNGKSLYRPKGPPIGRSSAMQTDPEVSQKGGGGKDVKPRNPGSQSLGARRNVDCDNMNGGDSMSATWMWCHLPS